MATPDLNEVIVTAESLPLGALAARVVCPTAGAIATFIGTTRDNFEGKAVLRLEYEAYQPMAERQMLAIIQRARAQWELRHVAISHRVGVVPTTESSVEIAVSSAHRKEALAAVHFLIDELKAQVPIWKKEIYAGEAACWKENKESSAPVIGQQQQRAADTNKMLAAAAAGAAALVLSAFLAVRARR